MQVDPTLLTALSASEVRLFHLLKIEVDTQYYFTDLYKEISFDGNVYRPLPQLLSIGSVTEELEIRNNTLDIRFSAITQSIIQAFLNYSYNGNPVEVYLGVVSAEGSVLGTPYTKFSGKIDKFKIEEDIDKSVVLNITAASHWADFERVAGRRTNSSDQWRYYSGDMGFEFAGVIIKDLQWGG